MRYRSFCLIDSIELIFLRKEIRYIPTIKISASSDNGETYTGNLKAIPRNGDSYLKCEVSVKVNGLLWWFFRNVISFEIEFPKEFELYDYTGTKEEGKKNNSDNSESMEYSVTVSPCGKDNGATYHVKVSEIVPKKATFSLAASDKPKKAEIIFKISGIKTVDKPMLTISFKSPAQSVYNKVVTLGVKKPVSTICGFSRITVDFLSFLIQ